MNFSDLTVFSLMKQKMDYLGARQAYLAQNIANADTAGYVPHDLKKPDFSKMVEGNLATIQMKQTNKAHLQGNPTGSGSLKEVDRKQTYETNYNKNRVAIEEEIKKVSETQQEYQMVTSLYSKTAGMFKTAIGKPS